MFQRSVLDDAMGEGEKRLRHTPKDEDIPQSPET